MYTRIDRSTISGRASTSPKTPVVGNVIYVWGGRGGQHMAPLSNGSTIHTFDAVEDEWSDLKLQEACEGFEPEERSYLQSK